jgi:hypothetical protein
MREKSNYICENPQQPLWIFVDIHVDLANAAV